jgi:cytochrome b561
LDAIASIPVVSDRDSARIAAKAPNRNPGIKESSMRMHYGTTAKTLHWLIVFLIGSEYLMGWLMPNIKAGMAPGAAMTWHISIGTTILATMVIRLGWRLVHPVAPERSLPAYQRISSEAVHWLLYLLVLLTTLSGWTFASARGWQVNWFFGPVLPMLTHENPALRQEINGLHQDFEWALLVFIGIHVLGALVHLFYYGDDVMRRMLPHRLVVRYLDASRSV